ncbi:MAG: nickel-dependent hydrogenase large subunit, partial [Candidatus Helarchaeota archaeon]|nr:nickel-dependent hydrogenase large subunit [Candidatus Helarchaeota archaeon]
NLEKPTFLAMQNKGKYDNYMGTLWLKQDREILDDFPADQFSQYIDRDRTLPGIYAHVKGDQKLLVGPLARYNIVEDYGIPEAKTALESIDKTWKQNLLVSNYLRLVEMLTLCYEGLKILEDSKLSNPIEILPQTTLKSPEGTGVVEAPRGTLIHHYQANNKLVLEKIQLLVATEINIPTINEILTKQGQKLYTTSQDLEKVKRQAQMIIRSFDPCISCATH